MRALWFRPSRLLQLQPHHVSRAPRSRLRTAREAIEASCASTSHQLVVLSGEQQSVDSFIGGLTVCACGMRSQP
eukprot:COSAG06_NODE_1228_length_10179_cov_3.735119_13_plen_74_part_00